MERLPVRGPAVRDLDLALPPERMPLLRRGRPLKRWRYVGVYGPELMLCIGDARVGPLPLRFWAVARPGEPLLERSTQRRGGVRFDGARALVEARGVRIDLTLEEGEAVETVSAAERGGYIWTRKQGGVPVSGSVVLDGSEQAVDGLAVVDDSAGYHERHTAWKWSAGVGRTDDGRRVAWNLVAGIHDAVRESERTVWLEGSPAEVGRVEFAEGLTGISFAEGGALAFSEWCAREDRRNLLLFRSDYRQPFGSFAGELPGGLRLAEGYGVMEEHDVRW